MMLITCNYEVIIFFKKFSHDKLLPVLC